MSGDSRTAVLSPIEFLLRSARVWPEASATPDLTYGELLVATEEMAAALAALGVGRGDRVALVVANTVEMLEAHYAVAGLGAVIVPLNTRLAPAELAYVLEHSGARCVIADEGRRPAVHQATAGLDNPPGLLLVGPGVDTEALRQDPGRRPLRAPDDETQLLSINYTSGTTSRPKGVMYTHRGAALQGLAMCIHAGLSDRSSYLWTLPMFHCHGWAFVWAVTAAGGCHVPLGAFDADEAWDSLERHSVTHFCGAPTVMQMLSESPGARRLDQPVRAFVGGAPPSPSLLARMAGLSIDITHLYGLTETYGPASVCVRQPRWSGLDADEQARFNARQGVPTLNVTGLRAVDESFDAVPADGETLGEVVVSGNTVTTGYYRDDEATAAAFTGEWFHTGDLGVIHPDGYLELRDRAKDVIISGGENISTIEVEHALLAHPDIAAAAVIGIADERWGEVPKAVLVTRDDKDLTLADVQEWTRRTLAGYKIPRVIERRESLPTTATGKVKKYELRAASQADSPQN